MAEVKDTLNVEANQEPMFTKETMPAVAPTLLCDQPQHSVLHHLYPSCNHPYCQPIHRPFYVGSAEDHGNCMHHSDLCTNAFCALSRRPYAGHSVVAGSDREVP